MDQIAATALRGKSILFVEQSHVLAPEIYAALEAIGANVLGPICTVEEAALLLRSLRIDGAVIDKDLNDSDDLLLLLAASGVPSVFSCNEPQCRSGENDCYRLKNAESDPLVLLKGLFNALVH
jgi:hypothetical protein